MEEIIDKAFLFGYFSGNASPLQKKAIETWLAKPEHRALYYAWLHEWELSHLQVAPDWQRAFEQVAERVEAPVSALGDAPSARERRLSRYVWLAAASFVLLLGTWMFRPVLLYQTVRTGFGEVRTLALPDGSVVTLNANSSLQYARFGFGADWPTPLNSLQPTRETLLTGEAEFDVRHLPNHQRFVVRTARGLRVTVLGTQFTVLSRTRKTQVALRSGRVQLTLPEKATQPPLLMRPGDLVTLEPTGRLTRRHTLQPERLADWKQRRFTFEKTSLAEVALLLEETYGLRVTIEDPALASRTISGSFQARNADELISLMAELLEINYARDNDHVTFTE